MRGWEHLVAAPAPEDTAPPGPEDLVRYFDGAPLAWRHVWAPEPRVPRREVVGEVVRTILRAGGQTMVLLVGPAGQGRTTAVRQAAVDLAGQGAQVLVRRAGEALDAQDVAGLAVGGQWVLVSDHAEEIAADVEVAVEALCRAGRRDVHWLLTARDVDWAAAFKVDGRGFEPSWDRVLDLWPARGARGTTLAVTLDDAAAVVAAWDAAGALGELAVTAPDERAAALFEAAQDEGVGLLGAALTFRHGQAGLVAHVEAALRAVGPAPARAFLSAAVAGAVGIDGVDLLAVAGLVEMDPASLAAGLGEQGLTSGSGGALRPRHPSVARAGFSLVDAGWAGVELEDLFAGLVGATGRAAAVGGAVGPVRAVLTCAAGLSVRLKRLGVDPARADRIACAAADAAAETSDRLLLTVARAVTYRRADRAEEGLGLLVDALPTAMARTDWADVGREYLLEMSAAQAGLDRPHEAIVLAVLALADVPELGRPTTTGVKLALGHIGTLCMQLDEAELSLPYRRLLRVTSDLGPRFTPKWDQRTRSDFRRFGVYAEDSGLSSSSLSEAFAWLADAASATGPVAELLPPDGAPPGFHMLEATLGSIATH